MFHTGWRRTALDSLDEVFDLVVIGAGITGCGVLLDAAQRGLRCLLV
jgi:glycerol-3-phosphate dehydrogenase